MRVLLVEDEGKVANALREGLQAEGFAVTHERTGEGAFFRAANEAYDLLLLDLGLPGRSGIDVLHALRSHGIKTCTIVLTARDTVADRVAGLDAGADDYVVKPFAFAELLARMQPELRRGLTPELRLQVEDLRMDLLARQVERAGTLLDLTAREFELLAYLMQHPGEVVSRESISHSVWQESGRSTTLDNVIDVHVARLRRKIEARGAPLIHTIRGVGFLVGAEPA